MNLENSGYLWLLLVKLEKRKKDTRGPLALTAAGILAAYCLLQILPCTRKI